MSAPIHMPPPQQQPISGMPAHQLRQHVRNQAQQLFAHVFRVMTHTQNLNQQLWEERQELHANVQNLNRRRTWLARRWSVTDDEKLLHLLDKQIETNTATILWCQSQLTTRLQLDSDVRSQLNQLLEAHRSTPFKAFVKKFMSTILRLGGVSAMLYVADYYYNGSKGWNAMMSALGLHHLKLQKIIGTRQLDWLKSKLGLQPHTIFEKFWGAVAAMVNKRDPSRTFFLRRLSSKSRWLASTGLGAAVAYVTGGLATGAAAAAAAAVGSAAAMRGGGGGAHNEEDTPPMLSDWAGPPRRRLRAFRCAAYV